MKVIFLDIDGVLNSARYDRERGANDGNIDKSRLPLLKQAADRTGAEIVLSSSWRRHWDKDQSKMTAEGRGLVLLFAEYGLTIFDKTPDMGRVYSRKDEIISWLNEHPDVEKFVILDDLLMGWGDYYDFLVRADPHKGRGLEQDHVDKIIELLNG